MSPGITELQLTDTSRISIPTDAILLLFLLIVFALLGYFFHNILENKIAKSILSNPSQTKIQKIDYIDPLLSSNNNSKNNNFLRVKERQINDFFSF